jgi:tetratricopeptide (TPR) repeat protein
MLRVRARSLEFAFLAFALFVGTLGCDPPRVGAPAESGAASIVSAIAALSAEDRERLIATFNRGVAEMDRFQPPLAALAFCEALALVPRSTVVRVNLAIALLNATGDENFVRSEQVLKEVLGEEPKHLHANYSLGVLLLHLARFDEARQHFARVLEVDPDDPDANFQYGSLIVDTDPVTARKHFEKTLEGTPHNESAVYKLQTLLRRLGDNAKIPELLERFQELKAAHAGIVFDMKYGDMGRYAMVIRSLEGSVAEERDHSVSPQFGDVARAAGLDTPSDGTPGQPFELATEAALGPGIAAADVDLDCDLDLFLPRAGGPDRGVLYRNENGVFTRLVELEASGMVAGVFGDYDADGDVDLFVTCEGPNRLYRNEGEGKFVDVTAEAGITDLGFASAGATWADADHDGDLDVYVAHTGTRAASGRAQRPYSGAPNALWRNSGDGTFLEAAAALGIDGGSAVTVSAAFLDVDRDRDLDIYLIQKGAANRLFINDRVGKYREATADFAELRDARGGVGALLADLDGDSLEDVLLLRGEEPPELFRQRLDVGFARDPGFAEIVRELGGALSGVVGDFDLDGDNDLAFFDMRAVETSTETATTATTTGAAPGLHSHRVLLQEGPGRFVPRASFGSPATVPAARGALAIDLDSDGALEFIVARAGGVPELWRAPAPAGRHWLSVVPLAISAEAQKTELARRESLVYGLRVEVKTRSTVQSTTSHSQSGFLGGSPPRLHFGLGEHKKADYVRFEWPDAVLQSEMEIAADQKWSAQKVKRKPSSCPVLFAFDGERFRFVTDILGVGGLGFFIRPGEYAPPDPTENVLIPSELLAAKDGRYLLRLSEPLEEVTYLDRLELAVIDHPETVEVFPDERFSSTLPMPSGAPLAIGRRVHPKSAKDDQGGDVLDRIVAVDRRTFGPEEPLPWTGYARDHWIELDFGDLAKSLGRGRRVLVLWGWVEYTYSHVNYAAWQAGVTMEPPRIEVPDGDAWRVAIADAGYPAGLPRPIVIDVSTLPLEKDGRLRIRTNMEIFWDEITLGVVDDSALIERHVLGAAVAELRPGGYPREYSPDGQDPTIYDYDRRDHGVPFKNLRGHYTRFGDVRELLRAGDDRFAIFGRGEEIALEFDATSLPPLAPGKSRTFVLETEGYCKDMDLYTAYPDTVEPLPSRAEENYPPAVDSEKDAARVEYERTWNTRRVE